MSTPIFDVGDTGRISTVLKDENGADVQVAGAGAAMTLKLRNPTGTVTDHTSSVSYDATKKVYTAVVSWDTAGSWRYKWQAFGTYSGVDEGEVVVQEDLFADTTVTLGDVPGFTLSRPDAVTDYGIPRISQALRAAIGMVRLAAGGQTLSLVTDDSVVISPRTASRMILPQQPVVSVASVTVDGNVWVSGTDYVVDLEMGAIQAARGRWFNWGSGNFGWTNSVTVVYTHGYSVIPDELSRVVYALTERLLADQDDSAVQSETIGAYSVTYAQGYAGPGLTDLELAVVRGVVCPVFVS